MVINFICDREDRGLASERSIDNQYKLLNVVLLLVSTALNRFRQYASKCPI